MGHWNDIDKRRELFIEHQEHVQGTVVKKKKRQRLELMIAVDYNAP